MILKLLSKEKKGVERKDIDDLLMDMIPKSSKNPKGYIGNLLVEMKNKDITILLDNHRWEIYGKYMGNIWKIYGKYMINI